MNQTDDLIDQFAAALKVKARAAEQKYGWNDGWLDPDAVDQMRDSLYRHLDKGDPRDVAIYCAFLWYHAAGTAVGARRGFKSLGWVDDRPPCPTCGKDKAGSNAGGTESYTVYQCDYCGDVFQIDAPSVGAAAAGGG